MNLLIVEDDENLATILQRFFSPLVDYCVAVSSMQNAKTQMQLKRFDIVTLDANLSDIRGIDTLKQIPELRKTHPDVIIIVFTGIADAAFEEEAIRCGADGFLSKADVGLQPGGILGAFRVAFTNVLKKPIRHHQSINLLEKLVEKIAHAVNPQTETKLT